MNVRDSSLGGGGMEACLSSVLQGARLGVWVQAPRRAPQVRGLMAAAPALAPALEAAAEVAAPLVLNRVVLVGIGFIVVVSVTVYFVTHKDSDEDERERCRKVKNACIEQCLPTLDKGWAGDPFKKCMRDCLEPQGCWGRTY